MDRESGRLECSACGWWCLVVGGVDRSAYCMNCGAPISLGEVEGSTLTDREFERSTQLLASALLKPGSERIPDTYELSIRLSFGLQGYDRDEHGDWPPGECGSFEIMCGRKHDTWRMEVLPIIGEDRYGEPIYGPAVTDVRDQTTGPDALALLEALLAGKAV